MSRLRKKPAPQPGKLPFLLSPADLAERESLVARLWREAGCESITPLTTEQRVWLAWELSACAAQPGNPAQARQDAKARSAIRAVRAHLAPHADGRPQLLAAQEELLAAPPTRTWYYPALRLLQDTRAILGQAGTPRGSDAAAARFATMALGEAGYPAATLHAVRMELRRHVKRT
jgi:hypothetical protein